MCKLHNNTKKIPRNKTKRKYVALVLCATDFVGEGVEAVPLNVGADEGVYAMPNDGGVEAVGIAKDVLEIVGNPVAKSFLVLEEVVL